jgi:hypothetical protein
MSSRHKFNPSYEFHPEFGYLCPSRQLRQNVRVGLAAAGFGILLGLVGAMMLPRHDNSPARTQSTLAVEPPDPATEAPPAPPAFTDAPAPPPATAPSVVPPTPAEPAVSTDRIGQLPPSAIPPSPAPGAAKVTSTEPPPAVGEDKPCTEETWPYFDSKCLWGPPRKIANESPPPRARAAAPAAAPVTASHSTRAHRSARRVAASERRNAANERRAAANERRGGDEPRVVATKKTRSVAARRRVREVDPRAAYAASPFGYQANSFSGRFADSTRYGRRRDWGGGWSW